MMTYNTTSKPGLRADGTFLRKQVNWENLYFYKKSEVLYDMTFYFTRKYLVRGDRTIDQMVQAARSTKQNIVEGLADEVTSTEMALKLLNVARASNQELLQDWGDYLRARRLAIYDTQTEGFQKMVDFCKTHNEASDYQPLFDTWSDEQMANIGLTLSHMVDTMMNNYIKQKEQDFTENGGIREQMTAARLGSRGSQSAQIAALQQENAELKRALSALQAELAALKGKIGTIGE